MTDYGVCPRKMSLGVCPRKMARVSRAIFIGVAAVG